MIPGINLSDTVLGVDNNHLLIALKTTPIDAPGRDALTHAARRNVDDLAQAIFLNRHADFTHHARTIQDVSDRTGMVGKVSMTIQENSLGEVIYISPGGMRKSIPARSIDGRRLERDQEVVIINSQHGVDEVDTWDHFIGEEESRVEATDSNELEKLRALLNEPDKADSELVIRKDLQKE